MAKSNTQTSTNSSFGVLFCTLVIVLASVVIQAHHSSPLKEYTSTTVASTKTYSTFEEFYPHYLTEHSQKVTRQWHYVGTSLFLLTVLINPSLLLAISAGGLAAYSSIPFFRHLSTGLGEMGIFVGVYILGGMLLTRSVKKTLLPMILGYGFAWIGHFYFEHNKPATFIYPTYSLLGDFRMIFDAIRSNF